MNKILKINDVAYEVVYVLPNTKTKDDAETVVRRYSTTSSPAILIQARTGEWFITKKIKDVIFTDIDPNNPREIDQPALPQQGDSNDIDNKEEN